MSNEFRDNVLPTKQVLRGVYEVIVVGAGHAGCGGADVRADGVARERRHVVPQLRSE